MAQPALTGHRREGESVDRREPCPSSVATLLVGATLVAMSLPAMNAVAQPSDGATTRREISENWNDYNQSTRSPRPS